MAKNDPFIYKEAVRSISTTGKKCYWIAFRSESFGIVTISAKEFARALCIPMMLRTNRDNDTVNAWNRTMCDGNYSSGRTESSARKKETKFQAEFDKVEVL